MISQNSHDWIALIVDNEPDNLRVAQKILKFNGAKIYVARNGLEGLLMLNKIMPTFILLDLSMPEMNGWEMFAKVRAINSLNHIPIIAVTAHAMAGDRERVLKAGFDGYIAKPFQIKSFIEGIRSCLSQFNNNRV